MKKRAIRVVMIDDDEDDFEIVRDLLSRNAYNTYEPIWIDNFAEGLRRLRDQDGDIFLVDYNLGEKTGLELLQEADGKNLRKPVVMFTGVDSPEVDLSAMEAGATYYIQKGSLNVDHLLERTLRYAIKAAKKFDEVRNLDRLKIEKEAALAANESKNLFLANVSHEIRTPLTSIIGFSDLALKSPLNQAKGEHLEVIKRNAEHVLAIVNDLLDLAKIEAGKYEVSVASTNWRTIIEEVMETLQLSAEAKGNQLSFVDDSSLNKKLPQILAN